MAEKTFERIKEIERNADQIIRQARSAAFLSLKKEQEKHAAELGRLEEACRAEAEAMLRSAREKARLEAEQIEARSQKERKELRSKTTPKIPPAKKEILRCLS